MQHFTEPSRATDATDATDAAHGNIEKRCARHASPRGATRLAHAGVAMLFAASAASAFAQQPAQPVPPPHGLTSSGATAGSGTSDTVITAKAKAALLGAKGVHGSHIKVTTEQGVVTLSGRVPRADEKARAASVVQGVAGVVRVDNTLNVDASAQ